MYTDLRILRKMSCSFCFWALRSASFLAFWAWTKIILELIWILNNIIPSALKSAWRCSRSHITPAGSRALALLSSWACLSGGTWGACGGVCCPWRAAQTPPSPRLTPCPGPGWGATLGNLGDFALLEYGALGKVYTGEGPSGGQRRTCDRWSVFNRPGVAEVVLKTPQLLINLLINLLSPEITW